MPLVLEEILFRCHRQKLMTKVWLQFGCACGQAEETMLLGEHSPEGATTLATASLAGAVAAATVLVMAVAVVLAVAVFMTVAVVMALTSLWLLFIPLVTLMEPLVGIDDHAAQGGQELGEPQATVAVLVRSGEELAYVLIHGQAGLRQDRATRVSVKHSRPGVTHQPTARDKPSQDRVASGEPENTLPPLWDLPAAPRGHGSCEL